VATVAPGTYPAHAADTGGVSGIAIVEIFELP
jgi:hypothetical protein